MAKITKEMVASGEARKKYGLDTSSGSQYSSLRQSGFSDYESQLIVFGLKTPKQLKKCPYCGKGFNKKSKVFSYTDGTTYHQSCVKKMNMVK